MAAILGAAQPSEDASRALQVMQLRGMLQGNTICVENNKPCGCLVFRKLESFEEQKKKFNYSFYSGLKTAFAYYIY